MTDSMVEKVAAAIRENEGKPFAEVARAAILVIRDTLDRPHNPEPYSAAEVTAWRAGFAAAQVMIDEALR